MRRPGLDLAVVVPTYNERENVDELIQRVTRALGDLDWELLFVDDDSPDGTAGVVLEYARNDPRIRLLHRIGRRGLASACLEGMLASSATCMAVMDADLQHDETILPRMLTLLKSQALDIVIGTRNAEGGSMGDFSHRRRLLSRMGSWVSRSICHCELTDPMSGFFLLRRDFLMETAYDLQDGGFKVLVDIIASSKRPVRFAEVGYRFCCRAHGESKLDVNTGIEFLFLILNKTARGRIPTRFMVFSLVGATGLIAHIVCLTIVFSWFHQPFWVAQTTATLVSMTENFFLNNLITYRDRTLRGRALVLGLLSFWLACSFGAWANVALSRSLWSSGIPWYAAGIAGVTVSSVWNYAISSLFTWQTPAKRSRMLADERLTSVCDSGLDVERV